MAAKEPGTLLPDADGIAAHWGVTLERLEPLGGGYHNTLLRAGGVVLRIEDRPVESVAWEHDLLAWLGAEIPEIVTPLPATDGTTSLVSGSGVVSLLPYFTGNHKTPDAAELIARIHRRGRDWPSARPRPGRPPYAELDRERNDWWDWSLVPRPPELVRAFERARAWVASTPPLCVTPVHGDLVPQNLLAREGRVVGVLDWEYARLDWPALELANAAWSLAPDDVDRFVRRYVEAGGPGEPEVLAEGVRIRLLANALYSLTCAAEGRPWSRDWVEHLLAELRTLDA